MFNLSGYLVPYPGHWSLPGEERINCRCSMYVETGPEEGEEELPHWSEEPVF